MNTVPKLPNIVARYVWSEEKMGYNERVFTYYHDEDVDGDDEYYDYDKICTDRKTGNIVVRYDMGDPANYAKSHGGWTYDEWLTNKGLNPDEEITLEECKVPVDPNEAVRYANKKDRKERIEKERDEANDLFTFLDAIETVNFRFENYLDGEDKLLRPALEQRGFTNVCFGMLEEDSFGPLTRECVAVDPSGKTVRFFYG